MSWGKTGESLLVRDNVGDPIMSWPLWEDKKEKASRLLSFLFHFLHHPHPHPNNHCNYQPVSFDNFDSLSWKPHWTKNEMQIHCPSLSCFVKGINCQPNTSFPLCLQYFSPKEKVSPCFVFFVVYIEGQSPWQWTEPVRAFRQTRSDFSGFYLSFMAEPCSDVFCISPATNIKMPDIAGTKISNWTWLLIFGRFLFPLGFVHKTISFLSANLNNDGDDDQLWKELGQWPLSGFRTAQLLFYERWW